MQPVDELKIKDMVSYVYPESNCGTSFGKMELFYHQKCHKFNNLPHLYPFFLEEGMHGNMVEWNIFTVSLGLRETRTVK